MNDSHELKASWGRSIRERRLGISPTRLQYERDEAGLFYKRFSYGAIAHQKYTQVFGTTILRGVSSSGLSRPHPLTSPLRAELASNCITAEEKPSEKC